MSRVTLGDVAIERRETLKGAKADYPIVGLEHLIPSQITLTAWGNSSDNTFSKVFHKGQVLFGRRRAYLKKAAVAPFDGLCSSDITVIEAKANLILPELLPFVIQNDAFFDYAVGKSAGSLSPRVKWEHLKKYEFELPGMDEQRKLAELLWSMVEAKEAYQELLRQTDDLVKARFIERFGECKNQMAKAGEIMLNLRNGVSPSKSGKHHERILTLSAVTQGKFDPSAWKDGYFSECPAKDKRIQAHEFYMCRGNGNVALVGTGVYTTKAYSDLVFPDTVIAAQIDDTRIRLPFLYVAWKMPDVRAQIVKNAKTTNGTYKINQNAISAISLIVPPLLEQDDFLRFVQKSDKSKLELEQAMKAMEAVYNKILSENLG